MKQSLQAGKTSSIGLDIGRSSIKAVQLQRRSDGKVALLAYGRKHLPGRREVDNIIHPQSYLSTLTNMLHSPNYGKFSGRNFAIALPSRHTYIQHNVSADEFVQQANQALGTTLEELLINTYRYNPSITVSIASTQSIIHPHLNTLSEIGTITSSDHELSATIRTLNITNQPTLIVDIGSTETVIGIYNHLLLSTVKVDFGVHTLVDILAKQLNMTSDEANELLFGFGFLPSSLRVKIREISKEAMAPLLANLAKEIKRYSAQEIILCGGGAAIPGIAQYIESKIQIPVNVADLWRKIGRYPLKPLPKKIAPMFTTAVGLALLDLE